MKAARRLISGDGDSENLWKRLFGINKGRSVLMEGGVFRWPEPWKSRDPLSTARPGVGTDETALLSIDLNLILAVVCGVIGRLEPWREAEEKNLWLKVTRLRTEFWTVRVEC
jgi:hypothetical protein